VRKDGIYPQISPISADLEKESAEIRGICG